VNVQGERILLFGDSLSHHGLDSDPEIWDVNQGSTRASSAPGDLLASMLWENGAQGVRIDANVSRSAPNFWTGGARYQFHTGVDLISSDQVFSPTQLVVFLGTNDLGLDPTADANAFTQIRQAFPNAEAWAIGPPIFADANRNAQAQVVYSTLQNVFGADHVIDSRLISSTDNRTADGVHFQAAGAVPFAQNLYLSLINNATMGSGAVVQQATIDASGSASTDTSIGPGDADLEQGGVAATAGSLTKGQQIIYGILTIAGLALIGYTAYYIAKRRMNSGFGTQRRRKRIRRKG
jgi:lysophospholipase L1-like esterase